MIFEPHVVLVKLQMQVADELDFHISQICGCKVTVFFRHMQIYLLFVSEIAHEKMKDTRTHIRATFIFCSYSQITKFRWSCIRLASPRLPVMK